MTFRPQSSSTKTKPQKNRDKINKGLRCTHLVNSAGQGLQSTLANSLWESSFFPIVEGLYVSWQRWRTTAAGLQSLPNCKAALVLQLILLRIIVKIVLWTPSLLPPAPSSFLLIPKAMIFISRSTSLLCKNQRAFKPFPWGDSITCSSSTWDAELCFLRIFIYPNLCQTQAHSALVMQSCCVCASQARHVRTLLYVWFRSSYSELYSKLRQTGAALTTASDYLIYQASS